MIEMLPEQTQELDRRFRAGGSPTSLVTRSRIVLLAAKGIPSQEIAQTLDIPEQTVGKWGPRSSRKCSALVKKRRPLNMGLSGRYTSNLAPFSTEC